MDTQRGSTVAETRSQRGRSVGRNCARRKWRLAPVVALTVLSSLAWPAAAAGAAASRKQEPQRAPVVRIEVSGPAQEALEGHLYGQVPGSLPRDIVDPCLGIRWELMVDAQHPERPGRLVQVGRGVQPRTSTNPSSSFEGAYAGSTTGTARAAPATPPLIRAGDRVTVIQQTAILRARFQAVALEPAVGGQTMRVRLLGGQDIRTGNQGAVILVRALSSGEVGWIALDRNP